jgi:hypothetical protein
MDMGTLADVRAARAFAKTDTRDPKDASIAL